jgi:hypothetical protein
MKRVQWTMVLAAIMALGATQLSAGEGGGRGGRNVPMTMDQIAERLGADNALTAEQKPKVEAANAEFAKKMEEANKKEGVAAAQEELKKAREGQDREATRAAYKKLAEAMGFNAMEEYKKALTPILNEAQVAKLFPARGGRPGGDAKKEEEKK